MSEAKLREALEASIKKAILKEWDKYDRLNVQMDSHEEAERLAKVAAKEALAKSQPEVVPLEKANMYTYDEDFIPSYKNEEGAQYNYDRGWNDAIDALTPKFAPVKPEGGMDEEELLKAIQDTLDWPYTTVFVDSKHQWNLKNLAKFICAKFNAPATGKEAEQSEVKELADLLYSTGHVKLSDIVANAVFKAGWRKTT